MQKSQHPAGQGQPPRPRNPQSGASAQRPTGSPPRGPSPGAKAPAPPLPKQAPITDEVLPAPPAKWKAMLKRVGVIVLIVLALALMYLFLLLGEPEDTADEVPRIVEETISVPMAGLETEGNADLTQLAATFGKPLLMLYGNELTLQKASLFDTAFDGGYARRATLTYAFADGRTITVDSLRPTAAASLLRGRDYSLRVDQLLGIGGLDAVRMDGPHDIRILAQSEEAVYAITCPVEHADSLSAVTKLSMLMQPQQNTPES